MVDMELTPEIRLKAILEGTGAGTWEWNLDTGEVIYNPRWADLLGYCLEELQPVTFKTWRTFAIRRTSRRPARLSPAI